MTESLGWVATAAFSASYFARRPRTMLIIQIGAALLWIAYGVFTAAKPVVVANLVVAVSGLWAMRRSAGVTNGDGGAG